MWVDDVMWVTEIIGIGKLTSLWMMRWDWKLGLCCMSLNEEQLHLNMKRERRPNKNAGGKPGEFGIN